MRNDESLQRKGFCRWIKITSLFETYRGNCFRPNFVTEVLNNVVSVDDCKFFCEDIYREDCQFFIEDTARQLCEIWKIPLEEYEKSCTKYEGPPFPFVATSCNDTTDACLVRTQPSSFSHPHHFILSSKLPSFQLCTARRKGKFPIIVSCVNDGWIDQALFFVSFLATFLQFDKWDIEDQMYTPVFITNQGWNFGKFKQFLSRNPPKFNKCPHVSLKF